MDKNRIVGSEKQIKGSIKKAVGKATGDTKLQSEGETDQTEGKIQNAVGGLKDSLRDAVKK
ncbi:MAG: CsbD family protein [Alphaproteobacteria bacterium]